MNYEKICGIYCIENIIDHKKYIGKSINIYSRWYDHKLSLNKYHTSNKYLQRAWNKYGEENFIFYIIEKCDKELIAEREIFYIALYDTNNYEKGYNLTKGGDGVLGLKHSKETLEKLSASLKGRICSEASKIATSLRHKGTKKSEETKKKMSEWQKGIPHTKIQIEKMRKTKMLKGYKRENASSQYIGVSKIKNEEKWECRISYEKKRKFIGAFKYEVEAALAYNEMAQEIYGWEAKLNIITQEEIEKLWMEE